MVPTDRRLWMKKIVCARFLSTWLSVLSLKVIFKARYFWSSKPQLVWISETQDLRKKWACFCPLLPLHPPDEKFKCRSASFTQTLKYRCIYKNTSVGRHWLWNDKPQKSLTEVACGKADLSGGWNRTVTGEAAFCGCYLSLLTGRWSCFMCSFLGARAPLPQLVIHSFWKEL